MGCFSEDGANTILKTKLGNRVQKNSIKDFRKIPSGPHFGYGEFVSSPVLSNTVSRHSPPTCQRKTYATQYPFMLSSGDWACSYHLGTHWALKIAPSPFSTTYIPIWFCLPGWWELSLLYWLHIRITWKVCLTFQCLALIPTGSDSIHLWWGLGVLPALKLRECLYCAVKIKNHSPV